MSLPFSTPCDTDRLRLLLTDQLSERAQTELSEHVAACVHCREALESLAGDVSWWSEVESCLRIHGEVPDSEAALPISSDAGEFEDAFTADFVVDFLEPCDEPNVLGRLGEYEIVDVVGRGGMGVVLKGFQRELARYVAVKVMAPHLATSGAARQRFIREARAAAAVVHPNVMPIHAVCTTARLPYLVMPFVACESLQQRIDRQGPLQVIEILRIGLQASHGLAASHAQGLVHRDIKPANILLEKGVDRVLLTDFGLARAVDDASLTRTGLVTGTPQYMSPEQACGEAIDARSDLFSLGSVLYAMCAGRPPFRAETALAVLRRITDTQARSVREINPEIPGWLERIVMRLHDKSPDHRFQTSQQVVELLEQCLAHVQQPIVNPLPLELDSPQPTRPRVPPLRNRTLMAIGGVVLMALLVWGISHLSGNRSPQTSSSQSSTVVKQPDLSLDSLALEADRPWNAAADDVQQLLNDVSPLESRALHAWDDHPVIPLATDPSALDLADPSNAPQQRERSLEQ